MGKLAKKVQGAIPVVSLVSKLLTPEGGIGVETLSYNEYCRIKLDAAGGTAYGEALSELCDAGKKEPRTLLLLTWMVYEGDGLLPVDQAMSAARRLASTASSSGRSLGESPSPSTWTSPDCCCRFSASRARPLLMPSPRRWAMRFPSTIVSR